MSATSTLEVRIDDRIKRHPDLLGWIEQATAYFEEQSDSHPQDRGENRCLAWQFQPEHIDGERVAVAYSEEYRYGSRHVTAWVSPRGLADRVDREVAMLRLWQQVLRQRWYAADQVFEKHLQEAEEEERNGRPKSN